MNTELQVCKKRYGNRFYQVKEYAAFGKTMENVRKQRYKASNNRSKKKLLGVTAKLSYIKIFFHMFISNTNNKNTNIHK